MPANKAERSFLDRSWLAHFSHGESHLFNKTFSLVLLNVLFVFDML